MDKALKTTDSFVDRLKKLVPVEVITLFGTVAAFFGLFEEIIFAQVSTFVVMGAGAFIGYIVENRSWNSFITENPGYEKKTWAIVLTTINGVIWIFLVNLRFFQQEGGMFVLSNDWSLVIQIIVACLMAFSGLYKRMDQPE